MMTSKTLISRKRPNTFENDSQIAKKKKLECKNLPNELWLKIMNYLSTKDLIKNLTLVCKNFKSLTKDVKYLKLEDISNLEFEPAINLLKTTKHLKEICLSTRFKYDEKNKKRPKNQLLIQALKSSKNIKSIKLQPFNGFVLKEEDEIEDDIQEFILWEHNLDSFKRIKSYCKELEHLHLRDVTFGSNSVISQIAQITSLKSFKISTRSWYGTFTPKIILELANNCHNLEAITFHIKIERKNIEQMKHALDTFFNARRQTLKSFEISCSFKFRKDWGIIESHLLEKLNLCQHLEEISMKEFEIQDSTMVDILNLPKLRTLVLQSGTLYNTKFWSFSQGYSLMNLKYLKLGYGYKSQRNSFTLGFAKMNFPVLERFALDIITSDAETNQEDNSTMALIQLVDNSPKLKSIQLYGEYFHNRTWRDCSEYYCRKRNIFVTFGTFTNVNMFKNHQKFQNDFENIMEDKDPRTKTKYDDMKSNFLTWQQINNWWTWD